MVRSGLIITCVHCKDTVKMSTLTFIKVSIIFCVLGKRKAVGNFKSIFYNKAQKHSLNHLSSLSFFLVMFDNLQDHLKENRERSLNTIITVYTSFISKKEYTTGRFAKPQNYIIGLTKFLTNHFLYPYINNSLTQSKRHLKLLEFEDKSEMSTYSIHNLQVKAPQRSDNQEFLQSNQTTSPQPEVTTESDPASLKQKVIRYPLSIGR